MCDSYVINLETENNDSIIKNENLDHDTLSSNPTELEIMKKKEYQQPYRECNREMLKQQQADRRKSIQCLQNIAEYCRVEIHDKETKNDDSQSSSDIKGTEESNQKSENTLLSGFLSPKKELHGCRQRSPNEFLNVDEASTKTNEETCVDEYVSSKHECMQENDQGEGMIALEKVIRKRERQQRYRVQNREKLKKREADRRKRRQCLQNITQYLKVELNDEDEKTEAALNLEGSQISYIERTKESKLEKNRERQKRYRERKKEKLKKLETDCIQNPQLIAELLRENSKKKEYQQRYREQNREKLKEREKERRKHVQCLRRIAELCHKELKDRGLMDSSCQSSLYLEQSDLELAGFEQFAFSIDLQKVLMQSTGPASLVP